MSDLVLDSVTSGYNLSLINSNFQKIQDKINNSCLQVSQGDNVMSQDLDLNSYALLNVVTNFSNNGSMLTVADAKSHFYQIGLVPTTTNDTDAINYGQVSQMIEASAVGTDPANVALYSVLASTTNGTGASLVGIQDVGGKYAAGTVEQALQEVGDAVGLRTALAADTGSTLVRHKTSATGGYSRALQAKLDERKSGLDFIPENLHASIADGTNVVDLTTYVQAAADWAQSKRVTIYWPSGVYRCAGTVNMTTSGVSFLGDGTNYVIGSITSGENTRGPGTWFWFDHLGKGFNIGQGMHALRSFGTFRSQPVPGASPYVPLAADWDIYSLANDLTINDLCLRNATKGIINDGGGRIMWDGIYGQPLLYGLEISQATDVCRVSNVHFWPFWSNNADVRNYMKQNGESFRVGRADNPDFYGLFSIGYLYGLHAYPHVSGPIRKARLVNCDFDLGGKAIYLEGDAARLYVTNFSSQQSYADYTGNLPIIDITGAGCRLHITNFELNDARGPLINVAGSSKVHVTSMNVGPCDKAAAGNAAFAVGAGSTLIVDMIDNDSKPSVLFSGTGKIFAKMGMGKVTATTDANGYITGVAHNCVGTPNGGVVTLQGNTAYHAAFYNSDSINVGFRVFNGTSALVSTSVTLGYELFYMQ